MAKKMILAILEDLNWQQVMEALYEAGYPLTIIDSTGGFLRPGKSTFIAAVEQDDVDDFIQVINCHCKPTANPFKSRATVMVFNLDHFEHIF